MEEERLWFAGVDWASETHQVRLSDARGDKIGERAFAHGGAGHGSHVDLAEGREGSALQTRQDACCMPCVKRRLPVSHARPSRPPRRSSRSCDRLWLPGPITPHVLRHSCGVALLQSGTDVTVIRDYLGHSSIATTSRYISTNLKMKREALQTFWKHARIESDHSRPWKPKPDLLAFLQAL